MSQLYEIMTVLSPNESEEGVEAIIGGLRQQLITSGAEILGVDVWGRRRLAYPIKKFDEGIYVLMHAEGPPNVAADFRAHTRIRESILREMILALDGAAEEAARKALEERGPEDESQTEAQIVAAEQRAAEKLAQVTAPVTAAAAGVQVVEAADLEAAPDDEGANEPAATEADGSDDDDAKKTAVAAESAADDGDVPAEDDAPGSDEATGDEEE